MTYNLPRNIYTLLEEALNDRNKSEVFARAIEESIQAIDDKSVELIQNRKSEIKTELYDSLRNELATKEFVRAEITSLKAEIQEEIHTLKEDNHNLRAEIKQNAFLLKILIGIAIFALTIANPAFVELIKKLF
jgi:hypothetical protein